MKKHLLGLSALVLAIVMSAFSLPENSSDNQVYTWRKYNPAGTAELSPVVSFTGSANDARDAFDCPDEGEVICARAYTSNGTPLNLFIEKIPQ